jgi:undecaprenyl-diphosphatase
MKSVLIPDLFRRADDYELQLCHLLINWSDKYNLKTFFKIVSRLGDGILWYLILLTHFIFISEESGYWLAVTGLSCTLIYKVLKAVLVRERPCTTHSSVRSATKPLDRYSFPSGHTLHAVCFCIVLFYVNPVTGLCVLPFTIAVGLSRVALGLHYPSDVGAGAVIGITMASLSITLCPL